MTSETSAVSVDALDDAIAISPARLGEDRQGLAAAVLGSWPPPSR